MLSHIPHYLVMFKSFSEDTGAINRPEIRRAKPTHSTSVLRWRLYLGDSIISTPTEEERSYQEDRNCREDQPKHADPDTNAYANFFP